MASVFLIALPGHTHSLCPNSILVLHLRAYCERIKVQTCRGTIGGCGCDTLQVAS